MRLDFQKYWNILNTRCYEILHFGSQVAHVAQSVEHVLGKDEVTGSIPVVGSILKNETVFRIELKTKLPLGELSSKEETRWPRKNLSERNRT